MLPEVVQHAVGLSVRLSSVPSCGQGAGVHRVLPVGAEAVAVDLQAPEPFLDRFLEGPADGHGLAHRLHLRAKLGIGVGEFLEGPPRDLHHHVVNRGLEGRRGFAGNVVGYFVQRVSDGQFRGDLGDGESRGLGSKGRAAGHAGVHLDGQDAAVFRADGELDIRSPRLHADFPDHLDRGVPERLVFLVREGLGGRDRDAVTGVYAHGVEILDGADDDHVVGQVAHDLEFVFLPADDRFLDQHLGDGTGGQPPFDGLGVFRLAARDAPARTAQGEGRPDDGGEARILHQFPGLFDGPREAAPGYFQADAFHGLLEQFPVLRHLDRLELGANEFDPVAVQRTRLGELDGDVQGGLSSERGQQHVGALAPDDLFHVLRGDGLDVGPVRHVRIRHDRGRIAVDQHDPVAFFA